MPNYSEPEARAETPPPTAPASAEAESEAEAEPFIYPAIGTERVFEGSRSTEPGAIKLNMGVERGSTRDD